MGVLRDFESRNVTYQDPAGGWPIAWERAQGCLVWDVEGRRYVDLTAAFGVAAAGHAPRRVVRAGQRQMATLLHAMGDVHPHSLKAQLVQRLSEMTYGRWQPNGRGKVILGNSGFEAVEAALKTARLATGRPGVIVFDGAYHGLGYGALNVTQRGHFRDPFRNQLREFGRFVPFPAQSRLPDGKTAARQIWEAVQARVECLLRSGEVGAILVEPIQARGGIRVPVPGFLSRLLQLARDHGALLILDEIYTGWGRTGTWFACEHPEDCAVPDLICLGKALTGGFPMSACVGRADLMDAAWPESQGEAIHTSTFLGHPVGCAMALAQIEELTTRNLAACATQLGAKLHDWLAEVPARIGPLRLQACGRGLMQGLELRWDDGRPATALSLAVIKQLLVDGWIVLPEGDHAEVIAFTPPLTIQPAVLRRGVRAVTAAIAAEVHRK